MSIGSTQATGYSTATLAGTVDPDGAATSYYWMYQRADSRGPLLSTAPVSLPSDSTPQQVQSNLSGLDPGTGYYVALVATSSVGPATARRIDAFTTPENPRLRGLRLRRGSTVIGRNHALVLSVTVAGAFDPLAPVGLYAASPPYRRWKLVDGLVLPARHGATRIAACPDGDSCPWLDQNVRFRVQDGPSRTRAVQEYVYPSASTSVIRENDGDSPYLDAALSVSAGAITGRFRSQPVFFYEGAARQGSFTLAAVARLRVVMNVHSTGGTAGYSDLIARARIRDPSAGVTFACYRYPILPDMGRSFVDAVCGQRRIAHLG